MLLDHGADVNARDTESDATPLYYAASWGRQEVVELLLAHGADPNARNRKGASVLQSTVENNQPEIAAILKRHGAK
jgi:ankyrin repeat protein